MTHDELAVKVEAIRHSLFLARQKRLRPQLDDKILADWNGFAIVALAKAAQAFDEQKYADAGQRAARFILEIMRNPEGGGCSTGTVMGRPQYQRLRMIIPPWCGVLLSCTRRHSKIHTSPMPSHCTNI
jgi:uncharacterized protein YyaL (SSP411 family)